jgi:hypothetical protein
MDEHSNVWTPWHKHLWHQQHVFVISKKFNFVILVGKKKEKIVKINFKKRKQQKKKAKKLG